jgi:hypothetical protein
VDERQQAQYRDRGEYGGQGNNPFDPSPQEGVRSTYNLSSRFLCRLL